MPATVRLPVVVAFSIVLATGCVSPVEVRHTSYPLDWPEPAPPASGCPDLSGSYSNADSASGKALLARWVLPETATPLDVISVVELDGPRDGVLRLRLYEDSGASRVERGRYAWKEGADYRCENGWLVLSETNFTPLLAVVGSMTGRFTLARDGSLVVERRDEGGGVVLVVPMYQSTNDWFLYRRLDPPRAADE